MWGGMYRTTLRVVCTLLLTVQMHFEKKVNHVMEYFKLLMKRVLLSKFLLQGTKALN